MGQAAVACFVLFDMDLYSLEMCERDSIGCAVKTALVGGHKKTAGCPDGQSGG